MDDRQALQAYIKNGSHEAFQCLVQQHAPMVYQACLRVLNDPHLAEDASQAAFLVLLHRGRRLPASRPVAGWLHTVAVHCAHNLRRSKQRQDRRDEEARRMRKGATDEDAEAAWTQLSPELDQALSELPATQRDAVVLRYLSGLSQAEAAAACGCPPETLHTRTQRGLEHLRQRLRKRDVRLSVLLLAGVLSQRAVQAAPDHLARSLFTACVANTGATQSALAVAASVQRDMVMMKMKMIAAAFAAVTLLGALISGSAGWLAQAGENPPPLAQPAPVVPTTPAAQPPTAGPVRWRAPKKIFTENAGQPFPLSFLEYNDRLHVAMVSNMKRKNPSLLLSTSADGGSKWSDVVPSVSMRAMGLAAGEKSIYMTATDGGGSLLFVQVDETGKELKRRELMPASGNGRFLGSRVIAQGKQLVALSAFDATGGNAPLDLIALASSDGGDTWSKHIYIRRGIKLGDLADTSPCAFGSGATVGWFFADGFGAGATGVNLAVSDDHGATWREQKLPPVLHASRKLARVIPLAAAATADLVYLAVGAFDDSGKITYFMVSSADRCKTWGEAVPISPAMKADDAATMVSLSAKERRVAFSYTEVIGDWRQGPMTAHVSLSENGGVSWTNLNALSGVTGSTMFPQVLIDATTGALHVMALARPLSGAPFIVTRTYTRQDAEAEALPDWFQPQSAKEAAPESF